MQGKFVLCFAAVLVAQTMSASVFEGEELKKLSEQLMTSGLSVVGHLNTLLGIPYTTTDAQKTYDKIKSLVTKGLADLENELVKLKESARKSLDPKIVEKIDELEKEFKKQTAEAKTIFDDKISKPINDKYKDDMKKFSESMFKSTKDIEATINKAIDGMKKP